MEVHLTPHQGAFLEQRVLSGVYATKDEAVQAAISLLENVRPPVIRGPADRKSHRLLLLSKHY